MTLMHGAGFGMFADMRPILLALTLMSAPALAQDGAPADSEETGTPEPESADEPAPSEGDSPAEEPADPPSAESDAAGAEGDSTGVEDDSTETEPATEPEGDEAPEAPEAEPADEGTEGEDATDGEQAAEGEGTDIETPEITETPEMDPGSVIATRVATIPEAPKPTDDVGPRPNKPLLATAAGLAVAGIVTYAVALDAHGQMFDSNERPYEDFDRLKGRANTFTLIGAGLGTAALGTGVSAFIVGEF